MSNQSAELQYAQSDSEVGGVSPVPAFVAGSTLGAGGVLVVGCVAVVIVPDSQSIFSYRYVNRYRDAEMALGVVSLFTAMTAGIWFVRRVAYGRPGPLLRQKWALRLFVLGIVLGAGSIVVSVAGLAEVFRP